MMKNKSYKKIMLVLSFSFALLWSSQQVSAIAVVENYEVGEAVAVEIPETTEVKTTSFTIPTYTNTEINTYPTGQCTWGVKVLASWAGDYWGNAGQWAASAQAAGYTVGTTPKQGAIAVWNDGGYGHVAYVIDVQSETAIQVLEANYAGNMTIDNYRGLFDPTASTWGSVTYIYPPA